MTIEAGLTDSGWDGHLLLLYHSEAERRAGLAAWTRRGLDLGEKVIYTEAPTVAAEDAAPPVEPAWPLARPAAVPPGPDIKHTPTGSCAANHHEPLTRARADAAVNRLGNSEMQERYDLDQTPAATPHGDQDEGVHQGPTPQPAHGDQDQGVQENPSR